MDKDAVIATLRAHRADLERMGVIHAALFGSLARGEAGPDSDIDIAIEMDDARRPTIYAYAGMQRYISGLFSEDVDVVDRASFKPEVAARAAADMIDAF